MIVPDKKVGRYLNEKTDSTAITRLCREGVLPRSCFLKGVALLRDDSTWRSFFMSATRFVCRTSLAGAFFLFLLSGWAFLYNDKAFVFLSGALAVCAFLSQRSVIAAYFGTFLIGLLTVLPDIVFGKPFFLYDRLFLISFLLLLWSFPSRRTGIRALPFIVFNIACYAFAVQKAFPMGDWDASTFVAVLSAINLIVCGGYEKIRRGKYFSDSDSFALTAVFFSLFPAIGVLWFKYGTRFDFISANFCFVWESVLLAVLAYFYTFVKPKKIMQTAVLWLAVVFSGTAAGQFFPLASAAFKGIVAVLFAVGAIAQSCLDTGKNT